MLNSSRYFTEKFHPFSTTSRPFSRGWNEKVMSGIERLGNFVPVNIFLHLKLSFVAGCRMYIVVSKNPDSGNNRLNKL